MARHRSSLDADYFEQMFRDTPDPWDLETSAYEQAKFADSLDALGERRYASGFEIGCAKGVLTVGLADRCAALLAIDVSETALAAARLRSRHLDHVAFERMAFPRQAPQAAFDLIIMSEVAYYWDDDDLARAAGWLDQNLSPGGDVLLVHYTGETDYPQSGDDAVAKLSALMTTALNIEVACKRPLYRLDLWRRAS